jgi:hypothetical protein
VERRCRTARNPNAQHWFCGRSTSVARPNPGGEVWLDGRPRKGGPLARFQVADAFATSDDSQIQISGAILGRNRSLCVTTLWSNSRAVISRAERAQLMRHVAKQEVVQRSRLTVRSAESLNPPDAGTPRANVNASLIKRVAAIVSELRCYHFRAVWSALAPHTCRSRRPRRSCSGQRWCGSRGSHTQPPMSSRHRAPRQQIGQSSSSAASFLARKARSPYARRPSESMPDRDKGRPQLPTLMHAASTQAGPTISGEQRRMLPAAGPQVCPSFIA